MSSWFLSTENIIMTVRRYSISSNIMNSPRKNEILHKPRRYEETLNNSKWARLHDGLHARPSSAYSKPDMDKITNRHSLQEYGNKNRRVELQLLSHCIYTVHNVLITNIYNFRGKVKTVTFLLPVDDIYTNRPVMAEHLSDRPACELSEIAETDS